MKRTKAFTKTGQIRATDSKFTGEEPVWIKEDISSNEVGAKVESFLPRAFSFYNYYLDKPDFFFCIYEFMMTRPCYNKQKAESLIKNWPIESNFAVIGSMCRMASRGVPVVNRVCDMIDNALKHVRLTKAEAPAVNDEKPKRPVVDFDKIAKNKVQALLCELEGLIDSWTTNTATKIRKIDLSSALDDLKTEKRYHEPILKWIKKYHDEYWMAFKGEDEQLVEGLAYLNKPALKSRIKALQEMFKAVQSWKKPKVARKPRQKRVQSADRQIKTLKYAANSKEYGLESVNPITIPGSQHLYIFNTKYKKLMVYHSAGVDGFSIKGCSLKGFDENSSYEIALRKPNDVLPDINARTAKQIEKMVDKLTTKKKKANGRINENCIIQRVITNRGL